MQSVGSSTTASSTPPSTPLSNTVGSGHGKRHNDARMTVRQPDRSLATEPERGLVLAVLPPGADATDEIAEMEELARTAGVEPVAQVVQHRSRPDPRTFVGKGKLD